MGEETGQSRRGLLKCMAWAGGGVVWTVVGGVPRSGLIGSAQAADGFSFVQISDSHIGFKPARRTRIPPRPCRKRSPGSTKTLRKKARADDPYRRCQPACKPASSTRPKKSSERRAGRPTTSPASMTCWKRTGRFFARFDQGRKGGGDTVSTSMACTSSA